MGKIKAATRRIWGFLKPPMSLKEAKEKGPGYLLLIILFYLVRDIILYVILPLTACQAIF